MSLHKFGNMHSYINIWRPNWWTNPNKILNFDSHKLYRSYISWSFIKTDRLKRKASHSLPPWASRYQYFPVKWTHLESKLRTFQLNAKEGRQLGNTVEVSFTNWAPKGSRNSIRVRSFMQFRSNIRCCPHWMLQRPPVTNVGRIQLIP